MSIKKRKKVRLATLRLCERLCVLRFRFLIYAPLRELTPCNSFLNFLKGHSGTQMYTTVQKHGYSIYICVSCAPLRKFKNCACCFRHTTRRMIIENQQNKAFLQSLCCLAACLLPFLMQHTIYSKNRTQDR